MKTEKITLLIGLAISLSFAWLTHKYLHFTHTANIKRTESRALSALEILDLRANDIKYKLRDRHETQAPVALVAIDDASVREIGRWPWSRDLLAELTEKTIELGAKSIAFDVIFGEPEKGNPGADQKFGEVVRKYPDRIVLGTYSENLTEFQPYQDLCVAEAFLKTGGDQVVKINPGFSMDESSVVFDELNWGQLFTPFFESLQKEETKKALKSYGKNSLEELNEFQRNNLKARQSASLFEYCKVWLTAKDPFLDASVLAQVSPLYTQTLKEKPELKDLTPAELGARLKATYKAHPIPQYGEWTPNIPELQTPANYTASFIAQLDADGYVRRYPLFFRSGNKLGSSFIPSMALQSYLLSNGLRAELKMKSAAGGEKSLEEFNIYDTSKDPEVKIATLPVDGSGQLLLNYYGRQMSLPYISAREIFNDSPTLHVQTSVSDAGGQQLLVQVTEMDKKEFFKNRSVIFGATSTGLYDLRNTPLEANYPGPELHLTMLANLLEQNFLQYWGAEQKSLPWMVFALGMLFSVAWTFLGSLPSLGIFLVSVIGMGYADYWLFAKKNILLHSSLIYGCVFAVFGCIQLYRYFTEEKKKRELKSTFSKYVSPAVVDELLKDVENLKLGGRRERMTAFFSDVRGFTTISEKLKPEELSRVLNLYLTPMTEIVFKNSGTLDKYMGDAIMAFFGAPVKSNHHAQDACRCALKSMEKLAEIQKAFADQGLPHIDIGIGINTGEMSVGNMGSNIVQNYTVMGDSVNLASRLEGINKEYGTHIVISEFTNADLGSAFTTREIDRVRVKGKLEPVRIFELICEGEASTTKAAQLQHFRQAYELYHAKKFAEAVEQLQLALAVAPDDSVSQLYVERCNEYLAENPGSDWDGVYIMKTK